MTLINFMFTCIGGPRCKEARLGPAGQPLAARRRSHKKHADREEQILLYGHEETVPRSTSTESCLVFNPLALELDIYSSAHHLCKM